jgi:hypothetical protein
MAKGARSVLSSKGQPPSDADALDLKVKQELGDGGARRRLGALRAPLRQRDGLATVGVRVT